MTKTHPLLARARKEAEAELADAAFKDEVFKQKELIKIEQKRIPLLDRIFPWTIKLTIKRKN